MPTPSRHVFPLQDNNHDVPNGAPKVDAQPQTVSQDSKSSDNDDGDGWHLVGTFKTTTADVRHYYVVPPKLNLDNYVRFDSLAQHR